jgi:hypothetical protein
MKIRFIAIAPPIAAKRWIPTFATKRNRHTKTFTVKILTSFSSVRIQKTATIHIFYMIVVVALTASAVLI